MLRDTPEPATPDGRAAPAGAGFLVGFALAYIGAFTAVAPLLQILAPLRAEAIDPADKAAILSWAVFFGAAAAGVSNVLAGWLSDRTRSRHGRRRPWIIAGSLAAAAGYGLIFAARTPLALIGALVVFQILFNLMFAPLVALFADRVPEPRKGVISAVVGMGFPLATMIGAVLIGALIQSEAMRYGALALILILTAAPFALLSRDPPPAPETAPRARPAPNAASWLRPFADRDFALAWGGRFLMTAGFSLVGVYLLYFIADGVGYARLHPGRGAEAGLSTLTALSFCGVIAVSLLVAVMAPRLRRRKPFAAAASACLAVSMVILTGAQDWTSVLWAFGLYGIGMGFYFAIELALITDVLPSALDRGRDLGLINLSATLPQALSPLLALALVHGVDFGFRGLFLIAGVMFLLSAACILATRGVR